MGRGERQWGGENIGRNPADARDHILSWLLFNFCMVKVFFMGKKLEYKALISHVVGKRTQAKFLSQTYPTDNACEHKLVQASKVQAFKISFAHFPWLRNSKPLFCFKGVCELSSSFGKVT